MITFYFAIQSLLDKINTQVLYVSRRKEMNLGIDYNSTVDADLLLKEYLHNVSAKLFSEHLSPQGRDTLSLETPYEPYEFDATYTNEETLAETPNCIIYRIIPPTGFDTTIKYALDKMIENCMIDYCVWQWCMDGNTPGWELYGAKYDKSIDLLISVMTRRINPARTYKLY